MKYLKYIQYLLFAISIVLLAVFYLTQMGVYDRQNTHINLFWAYALIGIGQLLALIFRLQRPLRLRRLSLLFLF